MVTKLSSVSAEMRDGGCCFALTILSGCSECGRRVCSRLGTKLSGVNGRDNDSSGPGAPGLIKEYYAKGMVFFSLST